MRSRVSAIRNRLGSAKAMASVCLVLFAPVSDGAFIVPSAPVTAGNFVAVPLTSATPGTLLASLSSPFSFATTAGTTSGTILSAVYRNGTGTLDFYYQINNSSTSVTSLARAVASNFGTFGTQVAYRLDGATLPSNPGFVNGASIPVSADRSTASSTVAFSFVPLPPGTKIPPNSSSVVLVISTDAVNFTAGNLSVIDGGAQTVASFQPFIGGD